MPRQRQPKNGAEWMLPAGKNGAPTRKAGGENGGSRESFTNPTRFLWQMQQKKHRFSIPIWG